MSLLGIPPAVVNALAAILAILVTATLIIAVMHFSRAQGAPAELVLRIRSWWVMFAVFTLAIALNPTVSIVFFALISYLALKEYFSLIPTRRADRSVLFWAYLAIAVQYYWVGIGWYGMFLVFIPIYVFLLLPMRMLLIGETTHFLRATGSLQWGLMLLVFGLSHLAFLLALPEANNPGAGGAGLVLYLVFLTQFNDVAQYVWGKLLGRHKVVPTVSPNKTMEGLIGGVLTTTLLAWLAGPWLTPLSGYQAAAAGLLIGFAGFIGDVNISALKRDLGVKDSGQLIPGHGGILDRVDSLTYTAPLFFHYLHYLHY